MEIQIILLNETQKAFIQNWNNESPNDIKAIICNYGAGDCIDYNCISMEGFEDLSTYFEGIEPSTITVNPLPI